LIDHPGETLSYGYIYSHVSKGSANNRVNAKYYCQRLIGTIRKEINERYSGFLIKTMDGEGYQYRRPELEWASLT
jgi:DNA-binding response OmpR family regulator